MMHTPTKSLDASRISTSALSPGGFASPPGNGEFKRSPTFKNTMTLSELIEKLVKQDVPDIDRVHAALAIQYLSLNVDKALSILNMPGAISGLVSMMFEGKDEAKQHAAGALAHLAVNEEAESMIVHSEGVLDALVSLLSTGSEGSREEAAAALENISFSEESAIKIARTDGAIHGLAMLLHSGKGKALENAIGALQNLVVMAYFCHKDIASAPGAISGITNVLWSGSPKAQESSAAIIGNLAVNSEIRAHVGFAEGLIDGLVNLLSCGTEKGKSDAAAALGNLAVNTEMRSQILEVPHVLYGLRCMLMEGSERHAGEAACCLQNLAVTTIDHKLRMAATEGLLLGLVNLMLRCEPLSQFQEDACSALLNLVVGCSENKKAVASVTGVMHALERCLKTGNARAQEHAAAVVQNLIFNSLSNRTAVLAVPELLMALSNLIFAMSEETKKAAEYAASCMASLARTQEGALAVIGIQGTVDGLIFMATAVAGNTMGSRKASISALQTLTQTHEAAVVLLNTKVADVCFLPILHDHCALQQDETGRRMVLQAAIGMAYLGSLDTRLLDRIPQIGVDTLIFALKATVKSERKNSKYKTVDLLSPLTRIASSDKFKTRLQDAEVVPLLIEILQNQDFGSESPQSFIEAIKLCWHMSFLPACKKEMIDTNVIDTLEKCNPSFKYGSWLLGLRWQLGMRVIDLPDAVLSCDHIDTWSCTNNKLEMPSSKFTQQHIIIIADQVDSEVQNLVVENLMEGGHRIWPHDKISERPIRMTDFVTAANYAKLVVIIMSPWCELSPCCRSQIMHIKDSNVPYLCINVGSSHDSMYVQHGYLQTELGSAIKVTPELFHDKDTSAFNGIVSDFIDSGAKVWSANLWLNVTMAEHQQVESQPQRPTNGLEGNVSASVEVAYVDGSSGVAGPVAGSVRNTVSANVVTERLCKWVTDSEKKKHHQQHAYFNGEESPQQLHEIIRVQEAVILRQQEQIEMLKLELLARATDSAAPSAFMQPKDVPKKFCNVRPSGVVQGAKSAEGLSANSFKKSLIMGGRDYMAEFRTKFGSTAADIVDTLTKRHTMLNPLLQPAEPYMDVFEETWNPFKPSRDTGTNRGEELVFKLSKELAARNNLFEDPIFPADETSLFADPAAAGRNASAEQTFRKDQDAFLAGVTGIEWKRPNEWGDTTAKVVMWSGGIDPDDVAQGRLGNCYYLAAIAGCATGGNDVLLKDVCIENYGNVGLYGVKFFINGKWATVIVDDRIPCEKVGSGWKPIFASPKVHSGQRKGEKELWPMIFEKAWAKLHLSYEATAGGFTQDACSYLSGGLTSVRNLERGSDNTDIWDECVALTAADGGDTFAFLSCAVRGDQDPSHLGLITGHAYSILRLVKAKDGHKFVQIRNPWGESEWTGDYCDSSPLWTPALKKELGYKAEEDGAFFMSWEHFVMWFERIEICDATGLMKMTEGELCRVDGFSSHWVAKKTAGGGPSCCTFKYNPTVTITVGKDCQLALTLLQPDVRPMFQPDQEDLQNKMASAYIWPADTPEKDIAKLLAGQGPVCECLPWSRQATGIVPLKKGVKYNVTGCTFAPGQEGAFTITMCGQGLAVTPKLFDTPTPEHAGYMGANWDPYGCCVSCHNTMDGSFYSTSKGPTCPGCALGKPPKAKVWPKPEETMNSKVAAAAAAAAAKKESAAGRAAPAQGNHLQPGTQDEHARLFQCKSSEKQVEGEMMNSVLLVLNSMMSRFEARMEAKIRQEIHSTLRSNTIVDSSSPASRAGSGASVDPAIALSDKGGRITSGRVGASCASGLTPRVLCTRVDPSVAARRASDSDYM